MCTRSVICGIAGQQAQVGVEPRCHRVVVARAQVAIAARHAVLVAPHQHGQLAVRLQSHHAVEDLHAGVFHAARPADVRSLVEARHQLDHQRRLLGRRGIDQGLEDRRILAGAIERLLHAHHRVVFRSLLDEVHHRIVGIVRMVQQDVAGAQVFEDVVGLAAQMQRLGCKGWKFQIRPLNVAVEEHHPRQVHGAIAAKDLVLFEFEVHAQPFDDVGMRAGLDLQPHRVALAPVVQLHADRFQQRPRFFLLEVEVGVARHAKRRVSQHFVAAVHAGEVLRDQVLQQHVVELAFRRRQANKAGQRAGHRHHSQHLRPGTAPLGPQQQRQAERLVQNPRKRMRRIDRDRRQQRIHFALEVTLRIGARFFLQFCPLQQPDSVLAQLRHQPVIPARVLCIDKAMNLGRQRVQRLVRPQPVVPRLPESVLNPLHQPGLADFDILVEIAARDGKEFHALQQRIGGIVRLFQNSPVELHPGFIPSLEQPLFCCRSGHPAPSPAPCWKSTAFPWRSAPDPGRGRKGAHTEGIQDKFADCVKRMRIRWVLAR